MRKVHESTAAGSLGPQAIVRAREEEVSERIVQAGLTIVEANSFLRLMDDAAAARLIGAIGTRDDAMVRETVEEHLVRAAVRDRLREVVRRKEGGGGYVLYAPNPKKKGAAKKSGEFPTKLQAKEAELQRFPPRDIARLKKLRKQLARLRKDPKKRAEKERQWARQDVPRKKDPTAHKPKVAKKSHVRKEGIELVRDVLGRAIHEALFREEQQESRWDEYISRLPAEAVAADRKLQGFCKKIEKETERVLGDAFSTITKEMKRSKIQAKSGGVKRDKQLQRTFLEFSLSTKTAQIGPVYIFVEGGQPRLELSDAARQAMQRMDPEEAKAIRGELSSAQEDAFESMDGARKAIEARDAYLSRVEEEMGDAIDELTALEVSVLRRLIASRKPSGRK